MSRVVDAKIRSHSNWIVSDVKQKVKVCVTFAISFSIFSTHDKVVRKNNISKVGNAE